MIKYFTFLLVVGFILIYTSCGKNDDKENGTNNNNDKNIPNCGTVTDIDGNTYNTVLIGNQCWMRENLKTTKLNDGTAISHLSNTNDWAANDQPASIAVSAYSWYNNDYNNYGRIYGALYNLTAIRTEKLCPQGWHVPDSYDWVEMFQSLSSQGHSYPHSVTPLKVAKALADNTRWQKSKALGAVGNNLSVNNISGFTALPGGYRNSNGSFSHEGKCIKYWINQQGFQELCIIAFNENTPLMKFLHNNSGAYVRCVKSN